MARGVEPKTQAVRDLIDEHGPDLTWNPSDSTRESAKKLLQKLGFSPTARNDAKKIDENSFNVKKAMYLQIKKKGKKVGRKAKGRKAATPDHDTHEVIAYVQKAGGLKQIRVSQDKLVAENESLNEQIAANNETIQEMEQYASLFEALSSELAAIPA